MLEKIIMPPKTAVGGAPTTTPATLNSGTLSLGTELEWGHYDLKSNLVMVNVLRTAGLLTSRNSFSEPPSSHSGARFASRGVETSDHPDCSRVKVHTLGGNREAYVSPYQRRGEEAV